jgi:ribosome-associated protein
MPFRFDDIPADPQELLKDCDVSFLRASGPGGQHRNKVETAVRVAHRPTGVTVVASDSRSQSANKTAALERLHAKLVRQFKPRKARKPTRLPKSAKEQRLREKSLRSRTKELRRGRPEE